MITKRQAQNIALQTVNFSYSVPDDDLIILDHATREIDIGWVFVYDSKKFVEQDDFNYALIGNGPILVMRGDGRLYHLGTALPVDEALVKLRERLEVAPSQED